MFGLKTPIHAAFWDVLGSKNWGKLKLFAFLLTLDCNKPELTSYEANCIKKRFYGFVSGRKQILESQKG